MMRLFIGIPLASDVLTTLEHLSRGLQSSTDNLRWSSPETWHITLQFLGETSPEKYDCVLAHLREIQSPPVPIWLEGTGFFDRAGVFYTGVNVSPELRQLQKLVLAATAKCGFIPEDRPYHPHVTLARAKPGDRGHALRNLKARAKRHSEFPAFTAHEFLLYESFLGPSGARHEVRHRFPLA